MAKPAGDNKLNNIIKKLTDPNYAKHSPTIKDALSKHKSWVDVEKEHQEIVKKVKQKWNNSKVSWDTVSKETAQIGAKIPNPNVPQADDIAHAFHSGLQKVRDNYNHFYAFNTTTKGAETLNTYHNNVENIVQNHPALPSARDRINQQFDNKVGYADTEDRRDALTYNRAMLDPEKAKAVARYLSPSSDYDISQIRDKYPELQPYVDSMRLINDMFSGTYGYGLKQEDIDDWYERNTYKRKVYDPDKKKWETETVFKLDATMPPLGEDVNGNKINVKRAKEAWAFYVALCDTNYNVTANIAVQNAKMSEDMAYTAGVDPNAADSYLDVLRNAINGKTNFLQGSKEYFSNYVWNPLSNGNFKTLAINTLVNLAETLDYAGVALRAGVSTVDQVGGMQGLVEGGDVWWSSEPLVSQSFQAKVVEQGWLQYADTEVHANQFAEKLRERGYSEGFIERWLLFASDYRNNYLGQRNSSRSEVLGRVKNAYTSTEANYLYDTGSTLGDAVLYMVDPSLMAGGIAKAVGKEGTKLAVREAVNKAVLEYAGGIVPKPLQNALDAYLPSFIKTATNDKFIVNPDIIKARTNTFVRQLELAGGISSEAVESLNTALVNAILKENSTAYSTLIRSVYSLGKGIDRLDSTLLKTVFGLPYGGVRGTQALYKAARKTTVVQEKVLSKWVESNTKAQAIFGDLHTTRNIGNLDEYLSNAEKVLDPLEDVDFDIANFVNTIRNDVLTETSYISQQTEIIRGLVKNESISSSQAVEMFNEMFRRVTNNKCTTYEEMIPYIDSLFARHNEYYVGLLEDVKASYLSCVKDIEHVIALADSNAVNSVEKAVRQFTTADTGLSIMEHMEYLESKGFAFRPETKQLLEDRLNIALTEGTVPVTLELAEESFKTSVSKRFSKAASFKESIGNIFGKNKNVTAKDFDAFKESVSAIVEGNVYEDMTRMHALQELYSFLNNADFKNIDVLELQHYISDASTELIVNSIAHPGEFKNLFSMLKEFSNKLTVSVDGEMRIMKLHMDHLEVLNTLLSHPSTQKALKIITDPTTVVGSVFAKMDSYDETQVLQELKSALKEEKAFNNVEIIDSLSETFKQIMVNLKAIKNDIDCLGYYDMFRRTIEEECGLTKEQSHVILDTVFGMSNWTVPEGVNKNSYFINKVLDKFQYSMDGAFGQSLALDNFRRELLDFDSDIYGNLLKNIEDPDELEIVQERIMQLCDNGHLSPLADTRVQMLQVILKDKDTVHDYNAIKESGRDVIFYDLETTGLNPKDSRIISIGYLNWDVIPDDADIYTILNAVEKDSDELHAPLTREEVFDNNNITTAYLSNLFKDVKRTSEWWYRNTLLREYYKAYGDINPKLTKHTEAELLEDFMRRADKSNTPCFVSHSNSNFDRNMLYNRLHSVKSDKTNLALFANTNWEDLVAQSRNSWQMLKRNQPDVLLDANQLEKVSEAFIRLCENTAVGSPNFRIYDNASILNNFKQLRRTVEELDSDIADYKDIQKSIENGLVHAPEQNMGIEHFTVNASNKETIYKYLLKDGDATVKEVLSTKTVDEISNEELQFMADCQTEYEAIRFRTELELQEYCDGYNYEHPVFPLEPITLTNATTAFEKVENTISDAVKGIYDLLNRHIDDTMTPEEIRVMQGGVDGVVDPETGRIVSGAFDITIGLFKKRMNSVYDALETLKELDPELLDPKFLEAADALQRSIKNYTTKTYAVSTDELVARKAVLYGNEYTYSLQQFLKNYFVYETNYINEEKAIELVHSKFDKAMPILQKLPNLKIGDVQHIEMVPTGVSDDVVSELIINEGVRDSDILIVWSAETSIRNEFPTTIDGFSDEDWLLRDKFISEQDYFNGDLAHDLDLYARVVGDITDKQIAKYFETRKKIVEDIYNTRKSMQTIGTSNIRAISSDLDSILPYLRNKVTDRFIAEHNDKVKQLVIARDYIEDFSDYVDAASFELEKQGVTVQQYVDFNKIFENHLAYYDNPDEFLDSVSKLPRDFRLKVVEILLNNAGGNTKGINTLTDYAINNTIVQNYDKLANRLQLQKLFFSDKFTKYIEKQIGTSESLTDVLVKYRGKSDLAEQLSSEIVKENKTIATIERNNPEFKLGVWDNYVTDSYEFKVGDELRRVHTDHGYLYYTTNSFIEFQDISMLWDARKHLLNKCVKDNFAFTRKKGIHQVVPSRYMANYKKLTVDGVDLFKQATHFKGTDEELEQLIKDIEDYQNQNKFFQVVNAKSLGIEDFPYEDSYRLSTTFPDDGTGETVAGVFGDRILATHEDDLIGRAIVGIKNDARKVQASPEFVEALVNRINEDDAPLYFLSKLLPEDSYYFNKSQRVVLNKQLTLQEGGLSNIYTTADAAKQSLALEEQIMLRQFASERTEKLLAEKGIKKPEVLHDLPQQTIPSDMPNFGHTVNELYEMVHSEEFETVLAELKKGSDETQQEMKSLITYFEDPYAYKMGTFDDTQFGKLMKNIFGEDSEKYSNLRKAFDNATDNAVGSTELFDTVKAKSYFKIGSEELPIKDVEQMGIFTRKVEKGILPRIRNTAPLERNYIKYVTFINWVSSHAEKLSNVDRWSYLKYLKNEYTLTGSVTPQHAFAVAKVLYDDIFKYSDITYRSQSLVLNSMSLSNAGAKLDFLEFNDVFKATTGYSGSSYLTPIRVVQRDSDVIKPYPVNPNVAYDNYNISQQNSDLLNGLFGSEIQDFNFRNLLDDEALGILQGYSDDVIFKANPYSAGDTYLDRVANNGYENAVQYKLMHDRVAKRNSDLSTLLFETEQLSSNPKEYRVNEAHSRFTKILDRMSEVCSDSVAYEFVNEKFKAVQAQRRKVFSEQILNHVVTSEDNLISHLLFNNQLLIVPLKGDKLHQQRVHALTSLIKESNSEHLVHEFDTEYLYVGINNKHRLTIANEGTAKEVISFEGFDKNYYRPKYSNVGFDTTVHSDIESLVKDSIEPERYAKLEDDTAILLSELDKVYKDLDFYSGGKFRGTLGVVHTANRQRKILNALPSSFKNGLLDEKFMFNEKLFPGLRYDMSILGDAENCFKITEFNESDLFLTTQHLVEESAGRAQAERVYFNSLFGEANVNRFSNMFAEYSDEEILTALNNNKEFVVVTARATDSTPSGIYIESLNMQDGLACSVARQTNAVVVPYDVYLDMVNTYNHAKAQTNTFLKIWSKAMLVMKVGHLSNPGTWIRNWIDATIKATGDIGDFGTTARYQLEALKKLHEYQKIVKKIETERSVAYHSQLDIKRHWQSYAAATNTHMTYEEFEFLEGWMQNGLSGGESSSMKAIKKRMANYEGTNMGLKPENQFSRNTVDDIPTRFRDLGETEVMKYYDELSYSDLKDYPLSRERFIEIFNGAECTLKEQRDFEQICNLVIKQRALSFTSAGFRMGRTFSKIFDVALSPMSGVEEVVRLGELLALQDKGYSYNKILQTISASQFNYDLKTMNARRLENIFLYYTFEKSNMIYWFRQLSENPAMLRALEDIWGSLSWDSSYEYVTDEEDPYGNNSLAYVMLNGGIPIGDSGLYLKTNPSFLSALNYYYGGPDAYLNAVAAPIELLAKTSLSRMGFDYRSMFGSMSEEFMNEDTWKKVLSTVPIAGTVYDRSFAPRHIRDTWERALEYDEAYVSADDGFFRSTWRALQNGDMSGALSATANYIAPSVFGVIKSSHKHDASGDFDTFRNKLLSQGKFYDCNTDKVLDASEYNTYGLNAENIPWDQLVELKFIMTGKVWDNNKGHFVKPEDYEWGGLNQKFDTQNEDEAIASAEWAKLCQLKYDKLGLVWDANQAHFVLPEDKIEGGLNQKGLSWEDKCYYMMEYRGLQWDNNQQAFVDKNHFIEGGLNGNIKFGDALNDGYTSSATLEWNELAALKYALHGEVWSKEAHKWVKVAEPQVTFMFGETTGYSKPTKPDSTDNAVSGGIFSNVLRNLTTDAMARTATDSNGGKIDTSYYANALTGFDKEHNAQLFASLIAKNSGVGGTSYKSGWADGYHYSGRSIVPRPKPYYPRFMPSYSKLKVNAYNMMYSYGSNDRTSRALTEGNPAYYQYYATGKTPNNHRTDWLARRTEVLIKREQAMLKYHLDILDSSNNPKSSAENHLTKIKSIWYQR